MDSKNPAEPPQVMGSVWGQARTDCLQVALILRTVLQQLSTADLLKVTLVNKQWNYEARSVLRDESRLTVKTISYPFCAVIRSFASDLQQMAVIPFSTLSIEMVPRCNEYLICELDPVYNVFLERLSLKQLSVRSYRGWNHHTECPAFVLFKKVLNKFASMLEELSLALGSKERKVFVDILQDCTSSFSRLKILKLKDECGTLEEKTNLIKMLLSRAPNLQVLHSHGKVNLTEIPLGSSVAHVTDFYYSDSIYEFPERILCQLRMKQMTLHRSRAISLQNINRVVPVLLQNSTATLSSIDMDLRFLVLFMCYGIRLENVDKLKLSFSSRNFDHLHHPQLLSLVKNFDFNRIFPRLNKVHISVFSQPNVNLQEGDMDEMIGRWNATEPMPDRAVNIKSLSLSCDLALDELTVGFFKEMYPHVKNLSVMIFQELDVPYNRLWQKPWDQLKELEILTLENISPRTDNVHLDSVICGIFPQEVAELREKGKKYLESVNIVPVMPSIVCLKGLRTLKLFFGRSFRASTDYVRQLLSRVTGLIVFARSPGLLVTLVTDDYVLFRAMRCRMWPYASVILGSPYN